MKTAGEIFRIENSFLALGQINLAVDLRWLIVTDLRVSQRQPTFI